MNDDLVFDKYTYGIVHRDRRYDTDGDMYEYPNGMQTRMPENATSAA